MAQFTEEDFLDALEEQRAQTEEPIQQPVSQPEVAEAPQPAPAFVQWDEYKSDPRFGDLSPAQKQNLFDEWQNYATQYMAQSGALSTDEDVAYTEKYFTDLAQSENLKKPTFVAPNYVEQLAQQGQSGFEALGAGVAGYSAALGLAETGDVAEDISAAYRRQRDRYVSPEMRKFSEDQLGFFGAAGRILTNPFDLALPMFIQSMGSNVPAIAGTVGVGAAVTAAATPAAGVPAALATGAVLGGATDAVVSYNEMLIKEVQNRGLDPADPASVKAVLDDPTFQEKALSYTAGRGVAIGAAELATLGAGKYIAKAAKLGKKSPVGTKIGVGAAIGGAQVVGEGVGEVAAQVTGPVLAGTPVKIEPKEVAAEMFVQAPGSVAVGALQTVGELLKANAPATASELTKEAVKAAAEGRYEQILGEGPTPDNLESYYNGLSIANKAKALGLAPNAVLTVEQGVYGKLSDQEKANVQADFERERQARVGPTLEEAEAKAKEAFPSEPEPTPAPAPAPAEPTAASPVTPAPAEPTAVAPAPTEPAAPAPAPVEPSATKPLTEAPTAPLATVAPATAAVVEAAPTPNQVPTTTVSESLTVSNIDDLINNQGGKVIIERNGTQIPFKNFALGIDGNEATVINVELGPGVEQGTGVGYDSYVALGKALGQRGIKLVSSSSQLGQGRKLWLKLLRNGFAKRVGNNYVFSSPEIKTAEQKLQSPVAVTPTTPTSTPAVPTPTPTIAAPAPAPAPAPKPAPAVKKLKPTKKQAEALGKLGYLPADIEGLDRNQAKDIIANQTPKTPAVEAPKEIPQAPAPTGAAPAPVAPAPVVTPAPTAPAQPEAGKAGGPVAPPAGQPAAPQTEQQRLTDAEKKLQEKVGAVIAEADRLGIDEESVRAWLGPTPSEDKVTRTRAVLRLLNLGIADVYNNLRKRATKGKARQAELIGENGARIRKVILTNREEGAGVLTDPEDMNNLETIYVNPDRLLSRLRGDETTDAADFFVKMMEEELLHLQHGRAALELFVALTPEGEDTPENFKKFFRRQSEEIENSLSLSQIQEVVGKYAGIDTAGKTKEQLIQEFAQVAGRRGRLGEEYLRTLIQRRLLGDITEDKIRDLTPNPVLRSLGMIRNWLFEFIGETIPKKIADQTPVERYFNAVNDLIYGNKMSTVREARDEKNTAIPGKETLSASIDPKAIRQRLEQKAYQTELVRKVNEDFGLGQPRGAQKGELWAKTVGKFISKFPSFTPDEITSIVGAEVPNAVKFFDPNQGNLFSTYLYQRGYYAMVDALKEQVRQRRESGRIDVPGSVERERFRPLSEAYKKVKPEEVTTVAKEDEIAAELESIENAAEEEATRVVAEQADEVEQAYSQVQAGRPEEDQTFEELLGEKAPSTELVSAGVSPVQAAIRSDLQKVFDSLFSTFTPVEQDVFDFLFRAKEMENPPTRKGIMAKHNIPHSRQYDRIVEDVREKTANILAENNIFSSAQLTASIDPFEFTKRRKVRAAVSALSRRYGFPVSFITSDRVPVEEAKLASAMSKLQALKITPEPIVFNFLHMFENQIDWNKVRTEEQLVETANKLYEDQKTSPTASLSADQLDWSRVEQDLKVMSDSDNEAGLILAEYNQDPGEEGQNKVLDYLNKKRQESVVEWDTFLTNSESNPFMRVMAWSIPFNALKQNKIGRSTVAIHQGAYSKLKTNLLDAGLKPIGIEKQYRKIMADIAKEGLKDVYLVSPTEQWVYIPSQTEDPTNFNANVAKLRYLSAITWCTTMGNEYGYLQKGGFWIFLKDNIGTMAIRKQGDTVWEIQGPANLGVASIPDDLMAQLENFKKIRPELATQIDDKIKAAKRLSTDQIQALINDTESSLWRSPNRIADLVTQQGSMTFEQKRIAFTRMGNAYASALDDILDFDKENRIEELRKLVDDKIQNDFRIFASSVPSPENNQLGAILFGQTEELLTGDITSDIINSSKFKGKQLTLFYDSAYSAYSLAKYLDNPSIDQDRLSNFFNSLYLKYGYTSHLASPKFFKSREEVLESLKGNAKFLVDGYTKDLVIKGFADESYTTAKAIKALLVNPLITRQDSENFLDDLKNKLNISDNKKYYYYSVNDRFYDFVGMKTADLSTVTRETRSEAFFIPKKDLRKISKADRIYFFNKYYASGDDFSKYSEKIKTTLTLKQLAKNVAGLGQKPVDFIQKNIVSLMIATRDDDRPVSPSDVMSISEDLKLTDKQRIQFSGDTVRDATAGVLGSYDQKTEVMPEKVRKWINRSFVNSTIQGSGFVAPFKALQRSIRLRGKMDSFESYFVPFTTTKELADRKDELLGYTIIFKKLLGLLTDQEQVVNLNGVTEAYLNTMLNAEPKTYALDLILETLSEPNRGELFNKGIKNNKLQDRIVDMLLGAQQKAISTYDLRRAKSLDPVLRDQMGFRFTSESGQLIAGYAARPSKIIEKLEFQAGVKPPQNAASVVQTGGEIIFDKILPSYRFAPELIETEEEQDDLNEIIHRAKNAVFRLSTASGKLLGNPYLSFDDFRRVLIGSKFLLPDSYKNTSPNFIIDVRDMGRQNTFDVMEAALPLPEYRVVRGEDKKIAKNYIQKIIPSYLARMGNTEKDFAAILDQLDEVGNISSRYEDLRDNLALPADPYSLRRAEQLATGIEAYYDTEANRLVFVEDNIRTEDRAKQLFFHEATHGNLAYLETTEKGKKELSQILNSARDQLMAMADDLAAQTGFESLDQLKLAYDFQDETELLSELLARYSESLVYSPEPSWFSKLMTDLILWLKRNLNVSFNEDDIRNWLAGRMQRAAEGERLAEISTPQLAVGPASIARNVLTASIDPKATSALRRAKLSMPEEVVKMLNVRTYLPYENKELLRRANDFVDSNMEDETDIYSAKRKLDQTPESAEMPNPLRILTLGVIGKRLKDAMFALDQIIKRDGNSPERAALRDKYSNDMIDVLSAAQDLLSASGQDLQAGRVFANLFTPEQMVRIYTKPISDAQKKLLASNQEVERLKAMIKALKEELASKAVDNAVKGINIPLGPEDKFYNFVGLFGDVEPSENESFQEYLNRMGIDYASLLGELEGPITASVDPKTNENPLPKNLRELNAREAVRRLVALDKNFFSKLIALRLKTGQTATQAQVATAQENKKRSRVSRENRPIEMQMVFDFFNSTLAQAPASEETIDKDNLPVMVRMAKYAADTVTDRILRSFGLDKKTTPKGLFDRMEREIRGYVNAQFRAEMDPKNVSVEDDRTPEQKIIDLVERIGMAEQVFNQTKANLQARLDEDTRLRERRLEGQLPDADRKALEDAVNRTFDPGKILARSDTLRQLVDFKAEARKHLSQRGATLRSLSNMIRTKFPQFNDKQAEALSSLVVANYDRLVKEAGQTQINNIIKRATAKEAKALLGKAKEPKKQYEKLLELINLGAFEDEKFYNAIAEGYGLPAWDPDVAADIRRRAEQVDRLPQGSDQRSVAGLQLTSFIKQKLNEQKKGYEKLGYVMDVAASVWKAGVLSGPGTQIINLASTYGNVGLELLFSAFGYAGTLFVDKKIAVNPTVFLMDLIGTYFDNLGRVPVQEAMGALITGYGRLRSETQRDISPLEAFSIDANLPKGGIKGAAKWSLNNYLALWKLVGRAMAAADTYNASIANEAKLRMQARYNLMAEGMTKEQADVEMRNLFSSNNDMMNGVRDQVEQEAKDNQFGSLEGLKPGTAAYKFQQQKIEAGKRRRLAQLREEAIATKTGIDLQEDVRNFAQVATFNNRPTGLIGYIGDSIATFGGRFPLFAPFTSFTRTVANIVNAGLNYTPYGFLRLAGFSLGNFAFQNTNYEFRRPEAEEFYKLAGQAVMGTLLLTALARLFFEDMEEPWDKAKFAVTGLGPTDKNQRDQLRATGWAENSVKIQTPLGPLQFRHSDIPGLSLVFGALGMMSDSMRYGTLSEEDKVTLAAYAAASLGSVVFEKNLLSGAKSLFDILRLKEDPVAALQKGAATYVGGITNPGAFKWLAETVGVNERGMVEKIDYRKLNSSVPGFLMGLTPIAVKSGAPKLNRLGEPVEEYPWAATTRRVGVFPEVKPHPVLSPLVGAGLFVPGVSRLTQIQIRRNGKPEMVRVDATENTYYDYAKYNGQYLKRVLSPARAQAIASRAKFDPEGAQAELEKLAGQARRYAIDRIEAQIRVKGLQ